MIKQQIELMVLTELQEHLTKLGWDTHDDIEKFIENKFDADRMGE